MRSTIALAVVLSLAAVGCKRQSDDPKIEKDPAPHEPKTPPNPAPPGDASLVLLHARVIDPVTATIVRTLEPSPPLPKLEASRGDRGYIQRVDALEAFDLRTGKKLWSQRASCTVIAAVERGVLCATTRVLDVYDGATAGTPPSLRPRTPT